jgi:hypothetical protein
MGDRSSDCSFANAAWSGDRNELASSQRRLNGCDCIIAADDGIEQDRKCSARRTKSMLRIVRVPVVMHGKYETITAHWYGFDGSSRFPAVPKGLPDRAYLNPKIRLFDRNIGPNKAHQVAHAHDFSRLRHKQKENIEGAPTHWDDVVAKKQRPLLRAKPKICKCVPLV